ncbi:MAG: IS200/IS605 family transposase [Chloroflexi bacterium]|nr:IS200/IS605 family transposase [Chloroflexota bacterium]
MPADLLVVTSSNPVGDSIRRSLEETGLYRVQVVNNKAAALIRAEEEGFPMAMIDLALGEDFVEDIGKSLRTLRPGINLVILCEGNLHPPAFDSLQPWILVRKPFESSDFMAAINRPQGSQAVETSSFPWLNDVSKAAQHLTRLTLESSAQAALITRDKQLWAYAGELPQDAAKEVANIASRNSDGQQGSDLLRFIRLESTKAEHMLYATRLASDALLALIFDAETPFSTIRSQAGKLVTDLGDERPGDPQAGAPAPMPGEPELDDLETGDLPEGIQISDILNNVPSPNPEPAAKSGLKWPRKQEKFNPNETRVAKSLSDATVFKRNPSPFYVANEPAPSETSGIANPEFKIDGMELTAPARQKKQRPETPVARPAGETDATRESPTTEAARKLVLEPTSAGLYHLTYACMLVPRFSSHFLTGDLSDTINEWLPNICIAFGWRLEFLAIRPEYLQWVVNVPPNTSPGYLMRIMRQQTSEKIYQEYPQYKKENPSGDFWAPGYLIMNGSQPHPQQLVRDYIQRIRQRQGHEPPPAGKTPLKKP